MSSSTKEANVTNLEIKETEKQKNGFSLLNLTKNLKFSKKKNNVIYKSYAFYLVLLLLIINGTGTLIMWTTNVFDNFINEIFTLQEDGEFYRIWLEPKSELIIKVYPFNYTNFDKVLAGREEKLKVQELGPYVFSEFSQKALVQFNGSDFVTYSYNRSITYVHQLSRGTLHDTLITPNVVYIAAIDKIAKEQPWQLPGLNLYLTLLKSRPFAEISANGFIMGYDDNFSTMLRRINTFLKKEVHPPFGVLSKRFGLNLDNTTIGTGVNDMSQFGIIQKFNGLEKLNHWKGDLCNNITASDGSLFPLTFIAKSDVIYTYAKDICRRIPLKFEKEYTSDEGFPTRRFVVTPDVFASPDINPENSCFCLEKCSISGLQNVAPCFFDAPFALSLPHFMYGDEKLFEKIDGLHPEPEKHSYFTDIHKDLSIPLKGNIRVQLSIIVNKGTTLANRVRSLRQGVVLPLTWLDFEFSTLPENINSLLYVVTNVTPLVKTTLLWTFPILLICFSLLLIYLIKSNCSKTFTPLHK